MTQQTDEPTKSKLPWILGCLGAGCLLPVIVLVVVFIGFVIYAQGFISPEPTVTVAPPPAPEEQARVERKIKDYTSTLNTNAEPEPLSITSEDINVIAAKQLVNLQDRVRATIRKIEGDTVIADFSAALDENASQWINGTAKVKVTIMDGDLDYDILEISTPDRDVPQAILDTLAPEIERQLMDDQLLKELSKIKSLKVEDGEIKIQLHPHSVE